MSAQKRPRPRRSPKERPAGLREAQKQDRFARIKAAARVLFTDKGYDATTLRMIGRRAKISAGTILRYVSDKRELLYLLFDDDHRQVTEQAIAARDETKSFIEQNIEGFRPYYQYFGRHPRFARAVLREATFYKPQWPSGTHAGTAAHRSIDRIQRLVEHARRRGEITIDAADSAIAELIFEIYQIEARRWLGDDAGDLESGLNDLRKIFVMLMRGLGPSMQVL